MNQERIFSLEGKKALISGAGRGIGFAIAEGFAKSGCDVGIFDKNFPQPSSEKIKSFKLDLSISEQIKSTFKDLVVNGISYKAGICPVAEETQPQIMQFKTNYRDINVAKQKAEILKELIDDLSQW